MRNRHGNGWQAAWTLAKLTAASAAFLLLVPLAAVQFLGGGFTGHGEAGGDREPDWNGERLAVPETVSVWITGKETAEKVDFEEYVCRVVASEMPCTFHEEALKAQSVAARTYAMARLVQYEEGADTAHPEAPVCDTTHCQVYKSEKALADSHEEGWAEAGFQKIRDACRATEGQLLYYDGKLVMQPLFFSSSGGQTENSEDVFVSAVPYLVSVASPYEEKATHRDEETRFDLEDFAEMLKEAFPEKDLGRIGQDTVKILERTAGGRVSRMEVGDGADGILKGTQVRTALGLSSSLFTIRFEGEDILFTSSGSGHGVGMSQYGADGMAEEGYGYKEILQHYYSGVQVG